MLQDPDSWEDVLQPGCMSGVCQEQACPGNMAVSLVVIITFKEQEKRNWIGINLVKFTFGK